MPKYGQVCFSLIAHTSKKVKKIMTNLLCYRETGLISSRRRVPFKMAAISNRTLQTQRCQVLNFLTLASIILEIGVCVMSIRLQGMKNCTSSDRKRSHNTCLGSVIYDHWRSPDRGSEMPWYRRWAMQGIGDRGSGIGDRGSLISRSANCIRANAKLFVDWAYAKRLTKTNCKIQKIQNGHCIDQCGST